MNALVSAITALRRKPRVLRGLFILLLGLIPEELVERQRALLHRFGLPTACSDVDVEAVTAWTSRVKQKRQAVR